MLKRICWSVILGKCQFYTEQTTTNGGCVINYSHTTFDAFTLNCLVTHQWRYPNLVWLFLYVLHYNFLAVRRQDYCQVTINTVDSFQGSEKDIIIISCVRDSSNSFLQNPNRLNVALTRAKQALYIIGNYSLFKVIFLRRFRLYLHAGDVFVCIIWFWLVAVFSRVNLGVYRNS